MPLDKISLEASLKSGIKEVFISQNRKAKDGDEDENPSDVIERVSSKLAKTISDAVDAYVRGGDIFVGPQNIIVTSTAPGTPAAVAPTSPAKIV